jgi:hypothetical protein
MLKSLKNWLGGGSTGRSTAAGVGPDESFEDLYAEFRTGFCVRPGVPLIAHLEATGASRLVQWLSPASDCAVPKGFIRLAVDATRRGYKIWEGHEPIVMNYEGRWTHGGLPPTESLEALSVLAQYLGRSIKLYYTQTEGGSVMVREFQP